MTDEPKFPKPTTAEEWHQLRERLFGPLASRPKNWPVLVRQDGNPATMPAKKPD